MPPDNNIIAFDPAVCRRLAIRAAGRRAIVSSVELAKRFDRRHDNVLRDIDELISHCSDLSSELTSHSSKLRSEMWFTPSVYRSSRGREEPACDMTRAGFVLLAMGWTGPKALAFKIAYIAAFDAMEAALSTGIVNPVSAPKARNAARAMLIEAHDARRGPNGANGGAAGLSERDIRQDVAPGAIAAHPEWLLAIVAEWLHDKVYHPWLRQERKHARDPDQIELFSDYVVARDGRKRAVARDRLTLGEKIAIIRRGFQLRAGLLKAIDKLWRHDRALIDEHNRTRPDEPAAPDEIAAAAPDLITQ